MIRKKRALILSRQAKLLGALDLASEWVAVGMRLLTTQASFSGRSLRHEGGL